MTLDTEKEIARFSLRKAKKIDLEAIGYAVYSSGYTLKQAEVEVSGVVIHAPCAECKRESKFLRVQETGQLFEIDADVALGKRGRFTLLAPEWPPARTWFPGYKGLGKHVVLKVVRVVEDATPERP
jgi:hypothetical protein